jgi:hypothetical protein
MMRHPQAALDLQITAHSGIGRFQKYKFSWNQYPPSRARILRVRNAIIPTRGGERIFKRDHYPAT